jgi:transcriptional regulator with XRE-family HTH domain
MSGTEAARKMDDGAAHVGEETAERFIAEKHIGERIKRLRLKKSMGLVELGRLTGLSASFLSQLETGRVVPTLRNLARVAMVFSKDLSYFFENEPQPLFRVHRRRERLRLPQTGTDHPAYFFESLGFMVPDRQMDPYFAQFLPGEPDMDKDGAIRTHVHPGCEFLYLLDGRLELRQGENRATLEPGDAVYFDSGTAHSYLCVGEKPASAVIVAMHQPGHQHQPSQQPVNQSGAVQAKPAPAPVANSKLRAR